MKTEMNFVNDLRDHLLTDLANAGYNLPLPSGKTAHDPHDVLMAFWNARLRRIEQRARDVVWSPELRALEPSLANDLRRGLADAERDLRAGADITPRLSRTLKKHAFNDAMLNDWGLHHIHLGAGLEADGFMKRSGDVLFALIRPDTAYFIDVRGHGAWEDEDLVERIHKHWPQAIAQFQMKMLRFENDPPSREERRKLRKGGVLIPFVTLDGTAYGLMGGGYATTGDNIQAVIWGDQMLKLVRRMADRIEAQADEIADQIVKKTGTRPDSIRLRLVPATARFDITSYEVHVENVTSPVVIPVEVR